MDQRTMSNTSKLVFLILLSTIISQASAAWGFGSKDPGKVLLKDVQVLTLKAGQMTTGRRSSPVQQLNCVGGSARGQFNPQVVQCYNRGWDGQDVQWECKSDMDNLYRYGAEFISFWVDGLNFDYSHKKLFRITDLDLWK